MLAHSQILCPLKVCQLQENLRFRMKSCQSSSGSEQKKQSDFRAITPTQLLELGLVYKPSHEVSTAAGVWNVGFDIRTATAAERIPESAGAPVQPHWLLISINNCCHMGRFAGTLLSRMITIQFCLVWDFSGIA